MTKAPVAVFGNGTYFSISLTAVGSKLAEGILPPGNGTLVIGSTGFLLDSEKSPARSAAVGGVALESTCD